MTSNDPRSDLKDQPRPETPPAPCPAPSRLRTLAELAPGARARVVEVVTAGSEATARRLVALGFVPGTTVDVLRRAPLGDPVVYRLKDYELCLRRAQAASIRTCEVDR